MQVRSDRGFTAVELIVVIIVVGIAAAVTVPALLRGARNNLHTRCQANLRALGKAEADHRAKGGATPSARGSAYWEAILGPGAKADLLACPFNGARYRGPAGDPTPFPPLAMVAADSPGSHGVGEGGNVLLKNGEVHAVRELDSAWKAAAERLSP